MAAAVRALTIGTRGSALARWQTDYVADLLRRAHPGLELETTLISTQGDRELERPLPEIGGKGLFTAELEAALLGGEIDLAVHSLKDLPVEETPGLTIGAIPERAAAGDVLVSRHNLPLAELPGSPHIGTSSLRRGAQIRLARPDAEIVSLRGNVDTRIRKAQTETYDAIVLAEAGVKRLGLEQHIVERLSHDVMLPAPGQGALAIHCRADDDEILGLLESIHNWKAAAAVTAERAFLAGLGGGCSLPVGAHGAVYSGELALRGAVIAIDGSHVVRVMGNDQPDSAEALGTRLAEDALRKGAAELLERVA